MKTEKVIERQLSQQEEENIKYFIKWFGKMNVAFVGKHCAVVLSESKKEEMLDNCLEIIEEIKKGPRIITSHVLEDGRGMLLMGHGKFFIHAVSESELSGQEITEDRMNDDSISTLKTYCNEALNSPEVIALGLRHDFINFMEDHFQPI